MNSGISRFNTARGNHDRATGRFSDTVIAIRAVGRITRQDYEAVLMPLVEATAKRHPKMRCYYEIEEFGGMDPGAAWEDFSVGVGYWARWERVAVVTDVAWIAGLLSALRFLMPGQLRAFPVRKRGAARVWIEAP